MTTSVSVRHRAEINKNSPHTWMALGRRDGHGQGELAHTKHIYLAEVIKKLDLQEKIQRI